VEGILLFEDVPVVAQLRSQARRAGWSDADDLKNHFLVFRSVRSDEDPRDASCSCRV
jgi:hypothetical protein